MTSVDTITQLNNLVDSADDISPTTADIFAVIAVKVQPDGIDEPVDPLSQVESAFSDWNAVPASKS